MAKKFSFADAKLRIKELEKEVESLILNTDDHVYTNAENKVIKFLKAWAIMGPALAIVLTILLLSLSNL